MDVRTETQKIVQGMLDKNEPFTSACISHPLIQQDANVRHYDVSQTIRSMWRGGQMIGEDGSSYYVRTNITVWPDGPGTVPANAWLYHPDSFDPDGFKPRSRVLVRSGDTDDGDDGVVSLTNTADGSTIQNQCQVQTVETTLNVPRTIIKKIGWGVGDKLTVEVTGSTVVIKKTADASAKRSIDQEGRIRLHGAVVEALQTTSPMALLVDPTGADKYIQISAVITTTSAQPATATDDDSDITQPAGKGVSVWG